MSIDKGIENGLATAAMAPWEFAPTSQQQLEWPKWGQYYETKGRPAKRLICRLQSGSRSSTGSGWAPQQRPIMSRIWRYMLRDMGRRSVFDRHCCRCTPARSW